jgi:hypothetical protein
MILMGILCGLGAFTFIFLLYEVFRCKHQWEFVDKTEFPPPIETAKKNGVDIKWDFTSWQLEKMSKKTVVIVIRCPKCGTAKVLRETH